MLYLIGMIILLASAFLAGLLVGKKNPAVADKAVTISDDLKEKL